MEKLNIAEILKDCPTGMELDCTLFEGLEFDSIVDNEFLPIRCRIKNSKGGYNVHYFTEYGQWNSLPYAKCVIFPKGKTTWEGFQRPFKDGDIIYKPSIDAIAILKSNDSEKSISYVFLNILDNLYIDYCHDSDLSKWRFATEEEKQKLFDVIKANGYKWNAETKTLEKLKVSRFDITTLKPFDKVLVRDYNNRCWSADIYSHYLGGDKIYQFQCIGMTVKQCIPYEGNQHLLGTTNNCDDYYKTW